MIIQDNAHRLRVQTRVKAYEDQLEKLALAGPRTPLQIAIERRLTVLRDALRDDEILRNLSNYLQPH